VLAEEAVRSYGKTIHSSIPGLRNVMIRQPIGVWPFWRATPWSTYVDQFRRLVGIFFSDTTTISVNHIHRQLNINPVELP